MSPPSILRLALAPRKKNPPRSPRFGSGEAYGRSHLTKKAVPSIFYPLWYMNFPGTRDRWNFPFPHFDSSECSQRHLTARDTPVLSSPRERKIRGSDRKKWWKNYLARTEHALSPETVIRISQAGMSSYGHYMRVSAHNSTSTAPRPLRGADYRLTSHNEWICLQTPSGRESFTCGTGSPSAWAF